MVPPSRGRNKTPNAKCAHLADAHLFCKPKATLKSGCRILCRLKVRLLTSILPMRPSIRHQWSEWNRVQTRPAEKPDTGTCPQSPRAYPCALLVGADAVRLAPFLSRAGGTFPGSPQRRGNRLYPDKCSSPAGRLDSPRLVASSLQQWHPSSRSRRIVV